MAMPRKHWSSVIVGQRRDFVHRLNIIQVKGEPLSSLVPGYTGCPGGFGLTTGGGLQVADSGVGQVGVQVYACHLPGQSGE